MLRFAAEENGDLMDLLSVINEESPLANYADIFPFEFIANGRKVLFDLSDSFLSFFSSSIMFSLNIYNSFSSSSNLSP